MTNKLNLLIVNQHGENRGDESAFKAMVRSFRSHYDCDITVIGQFRSSNFAFAGDDIRDVNYLNMVMPPLQGVLLIWCTILRLLRLPMLVPKKSTAAKMMVAYSNADLVISGPGGPYFGDIYRGHEPVHWLFVFLGSLHRKPVYLYAPSAGPFSGAVFNFFRRSVYKRIRHIICRESESASYIEKLDPNFKPTVTADSALQELALEKLHENVMELIDVDKADAKIVAISILQYHGINNQQKEQYEQAVSDAVCHLHVQGGYRFIFLPQLYGGYHSDSDYMAQFISRLPNDIDASLLNENLDSDAHRWIITKANLVLASRYHPQIFAASARTPFVAICYQHKSSAFMRDISMDDFAVDIGNMNSEELIGLVDQCIKQPEIIRKNIDKGVQAKESLARRTTQIIVDDFKSYQCN